jgi:hypothetical protein
MLMTDPTRHLTLAVIGGPDTDREELADVTAQLRRRLLELDVDSVGFIRSEDIPAGAKPGDAVTIGALAVATAPTAMRAVLHVVQTWLENRPLCGVKVTIGGDSLELSNASRTEQGELVQAFVDRHTL